MTPPSPADPRDAELFDAGAAWATTSTDRRGYNDALRQAAARASSPTGPAVVVQDEERRHDLAVALGWWPESEDPPPTWADITRGIGDLRDLATGPLSRCRDAADRMDAWWRENDTEDFGTPDQWATDLELLIACGRRPAPTGPGQGAGLAELRESIADLRETLTNPQYPSDSVTACVSTVDLERVLDALAAPSAPGEAKRARVELTCGGAADEGDCTWRRGPVEVLDPTLSPCADCGHIQANHHIHRHPDGDGEWIECAAGCRCDDWRPRDARAHGIAIDAIEDRVGATGDPELAQWVASAVDALLATGWTPPPGEQSVYEDRDAAPQEAAETEGVRWSARYLTDEDAANECPGWSPGWNLIGEIGHDPDPLVRERYVLAVDRAEDGDGGDCQEWLAERIVATLSAYDAALAPSPAPAEPQSGTEGGDGDGETRAALRALADATRALCRSLIAVRPLLDKTYPDRPELTPWTFKVGHHVHAAYDAATAAQRLLASPPPGRPAETGETESVGLDCSGCGASIVTRPDADGQIMCPGCRTMHIMHPAPPAPPTGETEDGPRAGLRPDQVRYSIAVHGDSMTILDDGVGSATQAADTLRWATQCLDAASPRPVPADTEGLRELWWWIDAEARASDSRPEQRALHRVNAEIERRCTAARDRPTAPPVPADIQGGCTDPHPLFVTREEWCDGYGACQSSTPRAASGAAAPDGALAPDEDAWARLRARLYAALTAGDARLVRGGVLFRRWRHLDAPEAEQIAARVAQHLIVRAGDPS